MIGDRSAAYKAGFAGLCVCTVVYLVGFASPFWIVVDVKGTSMNSGLWLGCVSTRHSHDCTTFNLGDLPFWYHVTRALEMVGLLMLLLFCIHGVGVNFCRRDATDSRALDVSAFVGGLLAFCGAMVYAGKFHETEFAHDPRRLGWAFYLATFGSVGTLVSLLVLMIGSRPRQPRSNNGVAWGLQQQQQQQQQHNYHHHHHQQPGVAAQSDWAASYMTSLEPSAPPVYHVPCPAPSAPPANSYSAQPPPSYADVCRDK